MSLCSRLACCRSSRTFCIGPLLRLVPLLLWFPSWMLLALLLFTTRGLLLLPVRPSGNLSVAQDGCYGCTLYSCCCGDVAQDLSFGHVCWDCYSHPGGVGLLCKTC